MYDFLPHLKSFKLLRCQNHLLFTSDGEPLSGRAMTYNIIKVTIQKIGSIS